MSARLGGGEAVRAALRAAGLLIERSEIELFQEQEQRLAAGARVFALDATGREEAARLIALQFGETRARMMLTPRLVADSAPRLR